VGSHASVKGKKHEEIVVFTCFIWTG